MSLIFVALLPYENILTTKFSQIMVYSVTWLVGMVNYEAIWIHKGGVFF